MSNWKKYLLWFAQEHVDFRASVSLYVVVFINCYCWHWFIFQEIESIISTYNLPMRFTENPTKEVIVIRVGAKVFSTAGKVDRSFHLSLF